MIGPGTLVKFDDDELGIVVRSGSRHVHYSKSWWFVQIKQRLRAIYEDSLVEVQELS